MTKTVPPGSLAGEVLRGVFWVWYDRLGLQVWSNLKMMGVWLIGAACLVPVGFSHPLALLSQGLWFFFCSGAAASLALGALGLTRSKNTAFRSGCLRLGAAALSILAFLAGWFYSRLLGGGLGGGAVLGLGISGGLIMAAASTYTPGCSALGAGPLDSARLSLGAAAAFPFSSVILLTAQALFLATVLIPVIGLGLGFSSGALVSLVGAERAAARLGLTFGGGRDLGAVQGALESEGGRTLREIFRPWEYR